jgi:hypothetical protein
LCTMIPLFHRQARIHPQKVKIIRTGIEFGIDGASEAGGNAPSARERRVTPGAGDTRCQRQAHGFLAPRPGSLLQLMDSWLPARAACSS